MLSCLPCALAMKTPADLLLWLEWFARKVDMAVLNFIGRNAYEIDCDAEWV